MIQKDLLGNNAFEIDESHKHKYEYSPIFDLKGKKEIFREKCKICKFINYIKTKQRWK